MLKWIQLKTSAKIKILLEISKNIKIKPCHSWHDIFLCMVKEVKRDSLKSVLPKPP